MKLPEVLIKADAGHRVRGVVKDTLEFTLEGAEITIAKLKRRVVSDVDGSFRFDSLPTGTFDVRARKIGYGPQILTIKVESESGKMADFALVPIARALPAVVTSAARLGLSGVVADTAFQSLAAAEVRVLPSSLSVETDSLGSFFLPVPAGKYMVTITKPQFRDRVVSVTIPPDSGRRITVSLQPFDGKRPVREAWNLPDLGTRLNFPNRRSSTFLYTREEMEKLGLQWASEAVGAAALQVDFSGTDENPGRGLDPECYAIIDGGPTVARISAYTVDELESIEVYNKNAQVDMSPVPMAIKGMGLVRMGKAGLAVSRPSNALSEKSTRDLLASANRGRSCPIVYLWSR